MFDFERLKVLVGIIGLFTVITVFNNYSYLISDSLEQIINISFLDPIISSLVSVAVVLIPTFIFVYWSIDEGIAQYTNFEWISTEEHKDSLTMGLIYTFVVYGVLVIVIGLIGIEPATNEIEQLLQENPLRFPLMLISTAIITPLVEEFIFRGVIQQRLHGYFNPTTAIGLASVFFAAIHLVVLEGSLMQMATYLAIVGGVGAVWGYMYYKSENLLVPIILHGVYNGILFTLLFIGSI